jgi:hypothetical protein
MEEHVIVRLDTMNQFEGFGELIIYFAREIVDNLSGMMQCPEPVVHGICILVMYA